MKRRHLLSLAVGAGLLTAIRAAVAAPPIRVDVFKTAYCECCAAWVAHMLAAGFDVKVTVVDDTAEARKRLGMPEKFGSCPTASVGGYTLEGHVPAVDVKRLLAAKPNAVGLAVPGMPVGSPGMEVGSRQDPFEVLLIDKTGRESVFASYPKV